MIKKIIELMDVSWKPARVIVTEDDGHEYETTWRAFVTDNSDTLEMVAEAKEKLNAGLPYIGGGGAAPTFTLTRAGLS